MELTRAVKVVDENGTQVDNTSDKWHPARTQDHLEDTLLSVSVTSTLN